MVVLVAGLCLMTVLAMPAPRTRVEALLQAALAAMPALLVARSRSSRATSPGSASRSRSSSGGLALGGSLLVLAVRALLAEPVRPTWQPLLLGARGGGVLG